MTTYNTGNALGSTDPRDLYDNAQNLDELVNSSTKTSVTDRLGRARKSWKGMEDDFADFLAASGYQYLGDYTAGITFTSYNQVVRDAGDSSDPGEFWRVSADTELPYTTTGAGTDESGALVGVGDAVLRQDLNRSDSGFGAELIAKLTVDTQAALTALAKPSAAIAVNVRRRSGDNAIGDGSDGLWVWDSTSTATADGGTILAADSGGTGRWLRQFVGGIDIKWFGARGGANSNSAINNAITAMAALGGGEVLVTAASSAYEFTAIVVKENVTLRGAGGTLKFADNTATDGGTAYYPISNSSGSGSYANTSFIDLDIDGNKANNTSFSVCDAITVGGSRARVSGCRIINPPDSGVMFSGVEGGECVNNYIDGATDLGIYVNDGSGTATDLRHNIISGNRIRRCQFGGIGIKRYSAEAIVSNNFIWDCGNGITVEDFGSGNNPNRLSILGNRLWYIGHTYSAVPSVAEVGISLAAASNLHIADNVVYDCSYRGMSVSGVSNSQIIDNAVQMLGTQDSSGVGIIVAARSGGDPCTDLKINGNKFVGCQGIAAHFDNVGSDLCTDIDFINNTCDGATFGMVVDSNFREGRILDNDFSGSANDFLWNVSGVDSKYQIGNNKFRNNSPSGAFIITTGAFHSYYGNNGRRVTSTIQSINPNSSGVGAWNVGDICIVQDATEQGSAASKYLLTQWRCVTAGSPGTWLQERCLTGN